MFTIILFIYLNIVFIHKKKNGFVMSYQEIAAKTCEQRDSSLTIYGNVM